MAKIKIVVKGKTSGKLTKAVSPCRCFICYGKSRAEVDKIKILICH